MIENRVSIIPRPLTACVALALLSSGWVLPVCAQDVVAEEEENEDIVVQATRSGRKVQDEAIRVEVIGREEIEEKLLMTPGNIAMLVSETGGIRVQVTSPALGASNVRVQGLRGRYTQILSDGLPLFGGQASSIGLLQIPPTDLSQVEIIKGTASALYGPSALGGVINLVSRKPTGDPVRELLVNVTSHNGQDVTAYGSTPMSGATGFSIVGGLHRQSQQDLDGDGWADISGYERVTVRPRFFWEGSGGATAFLTLGAMAEDRSGGTLPGRTTPDGQPFPQREDSRRFDAGLVAKIPVAGIGDAHIRAAGMTQTHHHVFGTGAEDDRHSTLFGEASLSTESARTQWLAGLAFQADYFRSQDFPGLNYSYAVPAIFAQVEHEIRDDLRVAASGRLDMHSEYGSRVSPRLSLVYRPELWTIRASVGSGFHAPTPFVEEIEAAGLLRLAPLNGLTEETAKTASLDVGYAKAGIEANVTVFASNINGAVRLENTGPASVQLVNVAGVTRTRGVELSLRYRWDDFVVTGSYVHVDAKEPGLGGAGRRAVPLTPRHTAGMVAMWEPHGKGRLGVELYYTGRQSLEDNPYRSTGRPYAELGALGEIILGRVSLFLNAENILNIRQTRYNPLLLPQRAPDGRWTVDAWAPLNGFTLNGGVRFKFGD